MWPPNSLWLLSVTMDVQWTHKIIPPPASSYNGRKQFRLPVTIGEEGSWEWPRFHQSGMAALPYSQDLLSTKLQQTVCTDLFDCA